MSEPSPFNAVGPIARPVERTALVGMAQRHAAALYSRGRDVVGGNEAETFQLAAAIVSAVARSQLDLILAGDRTLFTRP